MLLGPAVGLPPKTFLPPHARLNGIPTMRTVELLEAAMTAARQAGYKIRMECLGDTSGGACQIKGQKWLFIDPATSPGEQLEQVVAALQGDPKVLQLPMPVELQELLVFRRSA